ncbi:hypothetical protein [Paenibacillus sp. GP183]|uniref:hypothetical protein n=1 Tax=Paenibacillus sp. GP183 TaxID=1882751 RepID=UPI00089CA534|nr:hypothetical protein [Paenibacillus sp. GP183]SEC40237.1 hypothetical protein SAMN05443246_3977 [Paenibacillus sp. GP183]
MEQERLNSLMATLQEQFESGKLHINSKETLESMLKVRYKPDGVNVEPTSVDSNVRALALGVLLTKQNEHYLSIPLKESQEEYFKVLDLFFEVPFKEMQKKGGNPHLIAISMSQKPSMVKAFIEDFVHLEQGLREFWDYYAPVVNAHIRHLKGIKSVYGGDIFPSYTQNIAHNVGLYVDTIILPDPLLRTSTFFNKMPPEKALYYFAKHALNALQYKELALADVENPIIIISPDEMYLDDTIAKLIDRSSQENVVSHLNKVFGTSFKTEEEFDQYLETILTSNELIQTIKNPKRVLFDTDWEDTPESQISQWQTDSNHDFGDYFRDIPIGGQFKFSILGRMMQTNDIVIRSTKFGGSPLIDAPTSWQYLLWKYEYDLERAKENDQDIKIMLVSNSLTKINFNMIGKLTDQAIINLRRENALHDLRDLIAKGIKDIGEATDETFKEVTDEVFKTLSNAFDSHQKQIEDLSLMKKKFFGWDLTSMLVSGGLSIAAASTGNPLLSTLAASSTALFGAPSAKEVITKASQIRDGHQKIFKSPVGILIKNSK